MTKAKLTKTQQDLFGKIESELRKQCALCYIESGYENKTHSYLEACRILNKKPSKNPVTSGAEILNYPSVTAFINSVQCNVAEATQINAQYVLNRLKEIDELDILDIMNEELDGFKRLSEWPKAWRTSISGIDIQTMISGGEQEPIEKVIKKIKWPDKTKNLELIGRHVNVKAWEKEEQKESAQDITINFVDAVKPDAN
ncbi:terminase small subunit [Pseudoalteromonas sp.]|uniref:terminase small subunit n=1 Tax=Pseudoalteromonas sp. TaxID=53249 RepID=UPI003D0AAAE7